MIWVMINSKTFAEKPGKMNVYIYLSIDLNGRIKQDFVYVLKAKKQLHWMHCWNNTFFWTNCDVQLKTGKIWKIWTR